MIAQDFSSFEHTYLVAPLSGAEIIDTFHVLGHLISPMVESTDMRKAMALLVASAPADDLKKLAELIASQTFVTTGGKKKPLGKGAWSEHFRGRPVPLLAFVAQGVQVTYANFTDDLEQLASIFNVEEKPSSSLTGS
jgi:hypothetical protein